MRQQPIAGSILLLIACCVSNASRSQSAAPDVLASAGAFFQNANGSIAWTLGEPVIATHAGGSIIITQGFHQPEYDFSTGAPTTAPSAVVEISVFPNPTRDEVFVSLTGSGTGWNCTLYDLCGKIAIQQALPSQRNTLDLSAFANGPYTLHVVDGNGQLSRTFQLIIAK